MKKFLCTAESIGYLEETIEAENEEEASRIFQEHLDDGIVPETDGEIDNEQVVEIA